MGRKLLLVTISERGSPAICRAAKLPALSSESSHEMMIETTSMLVPA
jgi:hypothetical protein